MYMIIVANAFKFFQGMRVFINVEQKAMEETNARDCVIVEVSPIRLKGREICTL